MAAEINKTPTGLVAVLVAGALLGVALAVVALAEYVGFAMQDELDRKVLTRPSPQLSALREREATRLSTYQWVDQKAGIVRIPVERALELTLRDQGKEP
jgi:hypothetical protein